MYNLYIPETKLIHMSHSSGSFFSLHTSSSIDPFILEHSHIAIAIITGKMLILSIHTSIPSPISSTPEMNEIITTDTIYQNLSTPILTVEKDIPLGSLLTARCCFGSASYNDRIYVVGGYNRGDCLNTIEEYDPNENQWKFIPIAMTSRRGRVSISIVHNRIYVFGGSDGQKDLNTGEYFDLKSMNKWMPIKELSTPVAHACKCLKDLFK